VVGCGGEVESQWGVMQWTQGLTSVVIFEDYRTCKTEVVERIARGRSKDIVVMGKGFANGLLDEVVTTGYSNLNGAGWFLFKPQA
jgi:hypothetical protein